MEDLRRLPKTAFYRIITACGILITLSSIEILAKAKDLDYFNYVNQGLSAQGSPSLSYGDFIVSMLAVYVGRVILPVGLALNTYFALIKTGYNRIFIWSWGIFTLAALAFHLLSLELSSIFYYLFIICYLWLSVLLFRLKGVGPDREKEESKWAD